MKFLESGFKPIATTSVVTNSDAVAKPLATARRIILVTGYFGVESIIEFQAIIERNQIEREVYVVIGMAAFDGLTEAQHRALSTLATYLRDRQMGDVFVSLAFPIHSKVLVVEDLNDTAFAVIGSSNFTNLVSTSRQYETDLLVEQGTSIFDDLSNFAERSLKACSPFLESLDKVKVLAPKLLSLATEETVSKADPTNFDMHLSDISFDIPIKSEPHSHLNVFFGKGRIDSKGRELPRPWYEAEIIVSNKVTTDPNYPNKSAGTDLFAVITDDGWSFPCKVTGDYGKNFRSSGNLTVLGKWLKGRLEESGSLQPGQPVTPETLLDYGRDSMALTKIQGQDNVWFLDFSRRTRG